MTAVLPDEDLGQNRFWRMVARLREFEGRRCIWRLPVAAVLYAAVPLAFIAASVLAALIAGDEVELGTAILAAIVVLLGTGLLWPRLKRLELHRRIIATRLWSFEKPNPRTEVPVLIAPADAAAARTVLRRARFNPQVFELPLGSPPPDAPDLNLRIAVQEPEAWTQSTSDEDRTARIVAVLEDAGIRARVGGVDAVPSGVNE